MPLSTCAVKVTGCSNADGLALEASVTVACPLLTVKVWAFDVPPPPELTTVMLVDPAGVRSPAGTDAVSCFSPTYVVARLFAPNFTVDFPPTKFVPLTVIVNAVSPRFFDAGTMLVVVGTGVEPSEFVELLEPVQREKPSSPAALIVRAAVSTVPPRFVHVAPPSPDL